MYEDMKIYLISTQLQISNYYCFSMRMDSVLFISIAIFSSLQILSIDTYHEQVGKGFFSILNLLAVGQYFITSMFTMSTLLDSASRLLALARLSPEDDRKSKKHFRNIPADWPQTGTLELAHVSAIYPGTDINVLTDVSFKLQPREKVAIVGRTGAGKSSLVSILFRILDIEDDGGQMELDGIPIGSVPIHLLRTRIAIVPQDAYLFAQSIRFNPGGRWAAAKDTEAPRPTGQPSRQQLYRGGKAVAVPGQGRAEEAEVGCL